MAPDVISEGGQRWVKKALVKNGFLRATASSSVHAFVEQSEKGQNMLFRSTGSVCIAMSGTSAGVGANSATSFVTQPFSETDSWKNDKPTVEVRCHRHSAQNANLTTYNAK